MDYLTKFNDTFMHFIDDLSNALDDPELNMYKTALRSLALIDKNMLRDKFHKYVTAKYEEQITQRDEQFFFEDNFAEFDGAQPIIDKLRNSWSVLSDENKDSVWKYFKVLVLLDKKCEAS
jgi:hypothetical protein